MQAKRIQVKSETKGAGGQTNVQLVVPTSPREEINFHNIWGSVSVEPEVSGANGNGWWVLHKIHASQAVPTFTVSVVNNETHNANIIACGTFVSSNEGPFTSDAINPKTSRTLEAGDNLILSVFVNGVSSGNVRINAILCSHTMRK